jgi:hypothetical protein
MKEIMNLVQYFNKKSVTIYNNFKGNLFSSMFLNEFFELLIDT